MGSRDSKTDSRDTAGRFEEWRACFQEREELLYSMPTDAMPYRPASPSRFVRPEILAVMHDCCR